VEGPAARALSAPGKSPLREALEMIRFSHTVFALPFALLAAFRAAGGAVPARVILWVLAAMVGARTAAMTLNRIADRRIDARNPRTASRALPAGRLSPRFAAVLCAASSALFVLAARELNPLAFALSVPTLAFLFFYSWTKRFTALSHFFLGACLGIAPAGAWIAVRGELAAAPLYLGGAVLLWTAGFDILYSLQDAEFDRREGLFSIPAALGISRALWISAFLHAGTLVLLVVFDAAVGGGWLLAAGIAVAAAALVYQHAIVRPSDLSRIDAAFFTANGLISLAVGLLGILDLWLPVR
jgi:4-hydroxybenzoate polyprenyltransferase